MKPSCAEYLFSGEGGLNFSERESEINEFLEIISLNARIVVVAY